MKLAQLVREALERNQGRSSTEDTEAANELCRRHHIPLERAKDIIRKEGLKMRELQLLEPEGGSSSHQAAIPIRWRSASGYVKRRSRGTDLTTGLVIMFLLFLICLLFVFIAHR
ncbi:MAG: hypothetical protein JO112_21660 [Planctomycetes bacterium]|nr:hypothetical protein [Planctomycetota bacterium]